MKITKEKVVYFLSLVLVSNLLSYFIIFLLFLNNYRKYHVIYEFKNETIFYLFVEFLILASSLISFLYANLKKDKYDIVLNSVSICFLFSLSFSVLHIFVFFEGLSLVIFLSYLLSFFLVFLFSFIPVFLMSLIILKITDPLRRKINW